MYNLMTGHAKAAIFELRFSSQAYHQARDILCKNDDKPRIVIEAQLKKFYSQPPVRPDNSSGNFRFAKRSQKQSYRFSHGLDFNLTRN